MKKLILGAAIAAMMSGTIGSTSAHALEANFWVSKYFSQLDIVKSLELTATPEAVMPTLSKDTKIAVARLDGGRFIPTPHAETVDWKFLDKRLSANIVEMDASKYYQYIPEIPFQGQDTMNKIDEIRLAAANEGFDHVLIYGVGPDASWASFGRRALSETGLTVHEDCKSWEDAKAKALLVDSFSGEVIGAVTADDIEYNIGQLADRVGDMILDLSA